MRIKKIKIKILGFFYMNLNNNIQLEYKNYEFNFYTQGNNSNISPENNVLILKRTYINIYLVDVAIMTGNGCDFTNIYICIYFVSMATYVFP